MCSPLFRPTALHETADADSESNLHTMCIALKPVLCSDTNQRVLGNHHSKKLVIIVHARTGNTPVVPSSPCIEGAGSWGGGSGSLELCKGGLRPEVGNFCHLPIFKARAWRHPPQVMPRYSIPQLWQTAAFPPGSPLCYTEQHFYSTTHVHLFSDTRKSSFSALQAGHLWTCRQGGSGLLLQ